MVVDNEIIFKRSGIPLRSSFKNQVRNFFFFFIVGGRKGRTAMKSCQLVGLCSGIILDI